MYISIMVGKKIWIREASIVEIFPVDFSSTADLFILETGSKLAFKCHIDWTGCPVVVGLFLEEVRVSRDNNQHLPNTLTKSSIRHAQMVRILT